MESTTGNTEATDWIGKAIGSYVIKKHISRGGFGNVFKASHQTMCNNVAIKISYSFSQQDYDELLKVMRYSIKKTEIKGVLCPVDFGTVEYKNEKRFFVITEFIEDAHTLEQQQPVKDHHEFKSRIDLFKRILHTVEELHNYEFYDEIGRQQKGIVHGDLKPSNILIDKKGNYHINDMLVNIEFVRSQQDGATDLDKTTLFGTRDYMAPEQSRTGHLSIQTDIYTLGISLFEYLFAKKIDQEKLQLNLKWFTQYCKEISNVVPGHVVAAIWKATRQNQNERFVSVKQFSEATERLIKVPVVKPFYYLAAAAAVLIVVVTTVLINNFNGNDPAENTASRGANAVIVPPSNPASIPEMNYYGLFIAPEKYEDSNIESLTEPIKDAEKFIDVLKRNWNFKEENIVFLKNPTRNKVITALDDVAHKMKASDNLLIFYAGHGVYDTLLKTGFWLPVDARENSRENWISNSTIKDYINAMRSKHVLLIADACFSGSIFESTRSVSNNSNKTYVEQAKVLSRRAITSGNMSTVPDNSVFIEYLLKYFDSNEKDYLSANELFYSIEQNVTNNSSVAQLPQYGVIHMTGDEGGAFVFKRAK